jgi:hypothetical protein
VGFTERGPSKGGVLVALPALLACGPALLHWYNHEHPHGGIGLLAPAAVHDGTAAALTEQRAITLDAAFAAHPIRLLGFSRQSNRKADEGSKHPDRNAQFECTTKTGLTTFRRKNREPVPLDKNREPVPLDKNREASFPARFLNPIRARRGIPSDSFSSGSALNLSPRKAAAAGWIRISRGNGRWGHHVTMLNEPSFAMAEYATSRAGNGAADASGDVSVRLSALYGSMSALDGDVPEGSLEPTWRTKRRFNRRLECADKRNRAICYVEVIPYHSRV